MMEEPNVKKQNFQPVKDYAILNNISVQAVYKRAKKGTLIIKKIGTYTLVSDK